MHKTLKYLKKHCHRNDNVDDAEEDESLVSRVADWLVY